MDSTVLIKSGIDVNIFKPHSTRAAYTTAANVRSQLGTSGSNETLEMMNPISQHELKYIHTCT
jgi:hypothetical protein